ncbi:hypothetical protein HJG60_009939 [Phyllostomus discolor]|uniref:Uncharacterized protein n=1 Tax=Phyllostomus discolor TaxID=89673 RepID=A0A834B8M5_9CHIR|nr:hypothetical protein HJG60_009939 [Phyllostomus discolor]
MYIHIHVQMHLETIHQTGLVHSQTRQAQSLPSPHPPSPRILWLCEAPSESTLSTARAWHTCAALLGPNQAFKPLPLMRGVAWGLLTALQRCTATMETTFCQEKEADHLLPLVLLTQSFKVLMCLPLSPRLSRDSVPSKPGLF